ncbi:MAG: Ig-like domain-containing protein [Patescibacteria group bacterium]|nr:Ig-like domain-containing protein [Patescibacteria group bacterium]
MRLIENRKYLAIITLFIIFSTTSIVLLFIIVNTPANTPQEQDTTFPNVIILSPIDDSTVSGTILINMDATDANGISSYAIYIDGVYRSGTKSYLWDTTQESDGIHTILCEATDPFGKTGSNSISIIVNNSGGADTTPPIVTIISPVANSTVSDIVTITMSATDANGISSYAIYINDILRSGTNVYSWNTTQEINGSHTILCEAIDPSGNNGSDTISVTVNNSGIILETSEIFKLMAFNIKESGEDLAYPDWKTVVKEENADIIMFIETGTWDDNSDLKLNQYVSEFNTYFAGEDPYIGYCTQGISRSTDGAAIMSRYPVIDYNQITHVLLDNSTSYDVTHDFYDVEVNVSGTPIHIIGSHLKAMPEAVNEQRRELEQEGIINYMDNLGNVSLVYLGDLNSFSPEDWGLNPQSGLGYGPLSMMVSPYSNPDTGGDYSVYSSAIHSWTDVHRTLNPTDWGVTYPGIYNSRIDFIYVNQFLSSNIINSTTGDTAHFLTGSDHFTVDVFINLN